MTGLPRALERVRAQWQQKQAAAQREQLMALLADLTGKGEIAPDAHGGGGPRRACRPHRRYATVLPIRSGRETVRLDVATIDWIDAAGDYMCLHAAGQTHVLRATMKELEDMLDPDGVPASASLDDRQPGAREVAATAPERRMFPETAVGAGNQTQPQLPRQGRIAARPVWSGAENGLR